MDGVLSVVVKMGYFPVSTAVDMVHLDRTVYNDT